MLRMPVYNLNESQMRAIYTTVRALIPSKMSFVFARSIEWFKIAIEDSYNQKWNVILDLNQGDHDVANNFPNFRRRTLLNFSGKWSKISNINPQITMLTNQIKCRPWILKQVNWWLWEKKMGPGPSPSDLRAFSSNFTWTAVTEASHPSSTRISRRSLSSRSYSRICSCVRLRIHGNIKLGPSGSHNYEKQNPTNFDHGSR